MSLPDYCPSEGEEVAEEESEGINPFCICLSICFWKKMDPEDDMMEREEEEEEDAPPPLEERLTKYVNDNLMGKSITFKGPFGRKQVVYADLNSTGRSLQFLEAFVMSEMLPAISDSNTMTTVTGLQTALFLDESRNIFRRATNSGGEDELIYAWQSNAANSDGLRIESVTEHLRTLSPLVIFVDTHIDEKRWPWPWMLQNDGLNDDTLRIIDIPENSRGLLDMDFLERELSQYNHLADNHQLIGCFSAASRITGVLQNDLEPTALMHRYGGLAFWDYSTAGPHTTLDMNPKVPGDHECLYHKDAMFFSVDNFVGGMQTCGVLLIKAALLRCRKKDVIQSGGPVSSSAAIAEPLRASLAMQLKQSIGSRYIMERQLKISKQAADKLSGIDSLILLGNSDENRHLATFSFLIRHQSSGLYIHQNFVCALFNDLFGIQARAAPALSTKQGRFLFGIQYTWQKYIINLVNTFGGFSTKQEMNVIKPGYVTIDLPWFAEEEEINFILEATKMIAEDGWKFLPQYIFNLESGEWLHHSNPALAERKSLNKISYENGQFEMMQEPSDARTAYVLRDALLKAKEAIKNTKKIAQGVSVPDQGAIFSEEAQRMRWFLLPLEAKNLMTKFMVGRGPTCPDRLSIQKPKRIHSDKNKASAGANEGLVEEEDNPIGTLGGDAVFKEPEESEAGSTKKVVRSSWLLRQLSQPKQNEEEQSLEVDEAGGGSPNDKKDESGEEKVVNGEAEDPKPENGIALVEIPSHVLAKQERKDGVAMEQQLPVVQGKEEKGEPASGEVCREHNVKASNLDQNFRSEIELALAKHEEANNRNLESIPEEEEPSPSSQALQKEDNPPNNPKDPDQDDASAKNKFFSQFLHKFGVVSAMKSTTQVMAEEEESKPTFPEPEIKSEQKEKIVEPISINPPPPISLINLQQSKPEAVTEVVEEIVVPVQAGVRIEPVQTYIFGWEQQQQQLEGINNVQSDAISKDQAHQVVKVA